MEPLAVGKAAREANLTRVAVATGEGLAVDQSLAAPAKARPDSQGITLRAALPLLVGVGLALLPAPPGLAPNAWRYFALFLAVIVGLITEPLPAAAVGLVGLVVAATSGLVAAEPSEAARWALSGFANNTLWLIFAPYMIVVGYVKTGLGKRIALWLIRRLGKTTLGLGYATACADLILAPFTPSNVARSGGIIYPIIKNVPPLYGSLPDGTARRMGAYLLYTALAANCVTSSMFLTGLGVNLLALSLIRETAHISITWTEWFLGFLPVGILLFALVPALVYAIYPPEIKRAPEAPAWAAEELRKLGPMSRRELTLLVLILVALGLWIAGSWIIDPAMAAIFVVATMLVLGIISWDDILAERQAWNVLVWFATLLTLAGGLARVHFVDWLANTMAPALAKFPTVPAIVLLAGAFFFVHYLFATLIAHTTVLFPVFLAVAVTIPGLSPKCWALVLGYALGLMGILTPYATGPSPIYYGSGYISGRAFWLYGAILGVVFFLALAAIGIPWMVLLGL